ncbi:hypothetical protein NWP21_17385 [Anabaenopsis sp. FSS-46]|uniref:hypothetical protein n=1 Tax=Anabaenopsis sp. FSS-46 TaxID=2971766 RepID=UPI002473DB19|nr:hypothetical protein [Anabaenopsis sp. FSS-46]MDH6100577.1 hypothetical protein [Anabaenopsis sp. FSS-46]
MYWMVLTGCDSAIAVVKGDSAIAAASSSRNTQEIYPDIINIQPSTGEIVLYSQKSIFR